MNQNLSSVPLRTSPRFYSLKYSSLRILLFYTTHLAQRRHPNTIHHIHSSGNLINRSEIVSEIKTKIKSTQSFSMAQFKALAQKNWILYKRGVCGNILEILIPVFFIVFVAVVRRLAAVTTYEAQSFVNNPIYSATLVGDPVVASANSIPNMLKNCRPGSVIALAPAGDPLVVSLFTTLTTPQAGYTVTVYSTETILEDYIRSPSYTLGTKICCAITIDSSGSDYKYNLRFNVTANPSTTDGPSTSLSLTQDASLDLGLYLAAQKSGMLGTMNLVNTAILQKETSTNNILKGTVSPIYQQAYISDPIYTFLGNSIGIITLLPLLLIYLRQTSQMLYEKEKKIRESMSIMGMQLTTYYATWFLRYFSVYLVTHIIGAIIISRALSNVPFLIPFIVFILFDIVLIIQNFFIQIFFTRAKIGVVLALLYFVIQYVLSFLSSNSNNPSQSVNNGLSIIPHAAFVLAFQTMLYAESVQTTLTFTGVFSNYSISTAVISFVVNIIVYFLLFLYLDQVVPNEWGAKKHPLFCFFSNQASEESESLDRIEKEDLESVDEKCKLAASERKTVRINHLKKDFGDFKAVDDLSLTMYNDQIFALLGHNGAGKTTTISMLTGMLSPTSGSISAFGETELDKIRAMLGVCPQHDTLYDDLTVEEHLELYSTFKGLEGEEREAEVSKLIADVNLSEKRDEYSMNLSGGQKRRLSVAIAFAGRSKIIVLDEPTSGMDTSARRYIWELLKNYKNDRIIILTTHFMDEADYLGDRIGIMGAGKLHCCGSSIYLKNKFGVGYTLTIVKETQNDSSKIIETVQKHVQDCKVLSDVSSELSLQLPLHHSPKFSALFNEIDGKKKELKILQYGISITTLEEVFLKVTETIEHDKQQASFIPLITGPRMEEVSDVKIFQQTRDVENAEDFVRQQSDCVRFFRHFWATMLKRFRVIRRDFKSFAFELLLPIVIVIFALLLMRISFLTDFPAQSINPSLYKSQQSPVIISIGSNNSLLQTSASSLLTTRYGSLVSVQSDVVDSTFASFDQNFLFPAKLANKYLKGGIFFSASTTLSGKTVLTYSASVNTRSPTSYFFLPTLAAETLINDAGPPISITVVIHPLPRTYDQLQINNTISGFLGSFIFGLALAFKFASIVSFIVKEREDRSKHQQIVSGMKISSYWLANFVYDYALYAVIAIVTVVLCIGLEVSSFTSGEAQGATWILFILYGLSYISFTYLASYAFKDYGNAQAGMYFFTFVLGSLLPVVTLVLRILGSDTNSIGRGLSWLLRIVPAYAFGEGLMNLGSVNLLKNVENKGLSLSVYSLEITLAPIIYLAIETVLLLILVFVFEIAQNNEKFMRLFSSENSILDTNVVTDSDVVAQMEKTKKADPNDYQILTKDLRKVYIVDGSQKHKVAVDSLSFGIQRGEVFGLLGVNGAGKTTTFKMLAGEVTSTSGDSYFGGMKISDNIEKIRQNLGYCPQFDALIQNLTVREQIELFYDLKSLPSHYKDEAVRNKIKEMDLTEYEDKLSGTLSGGNKRKLSVAMAMIGNPSIVFLDQPSTGMDPKARRFMWKIISRVATERKQSTVILTTHSMEEAEALSTRLAIMVKGNFQCIGTPQHVKSKYGEGYEIEIKMKATARAEIEAIFSQPQFANARSLKKSQLPALYQALNANPLDTAELSEKGSGNYIFNTFNDKVKTQIFPVLEFLKTHEKSRRIIDQLSSKIGETTLLESLQNFIRLKTKAKVSVGRCFEFMEQNKVKLEMQQYTIKQATVEQIFNRFAESGQVSEAGA